jgi:hypothetical protein
MNYTNYILRGHPLQPERAISDKRGWREVTTALVLPASIVGVLFLCGVLPAAVVIDGGRYLKLHYILFKKQQRKVKYYKSVLVSLGHNKNEWYKLNAA